MTFAELVEKILEPLNSLVPLLFGITFIIIIWQVIQAWVINGGDKEAVKKGRTTLLTGIIVMVVLLCVWGIVAFVRTIFLS